MIIGRQKPKFCLFLHAIRRDMILSELNYSNRRAKMYGGIVNGFGFILCITINGIFFKAV